MKREVTMKDIAKEVGVSVATVSHVINSTKKISKTTQEKVLSVVNKYNYVPNSAAKNLRKQTSKTAGLVVSSFLDSFVTEMISGIEKRAKEMGYNLLLVNTNEDSNYEEETINLLHSRQVDGIILSPTSGDIQYLKSYMNDNFPIVMVNRYDKKIDNIPRVIGDNFQLGFNATTHLLEHGHKKIGFIYSYPDVSTTDDRKLGYQEALKNSHLPFNKDFFAQGYATVKGGANATEELLQLDKDITALFVQNDLMTIGAIGKIKELGLSIPKDIAIIGFGDFSSAHIINPAITNIVLPPATIGKTAFDVLLNKISNPSYMNHIELPPSMIIRNSCGC